MRSKRFAVVAALFVLLLAAGFFIPTVKLVALKALGRAPACPLSNALRAGDELRQQIYHKDRILYASRLLETDPTGFHHWQTPRGDWWIPAGDDFVLPFNLAEQERHIYATASHDIHPGDIVLDCGANVGVYTRPALAKGARLVVAIEPAPENLEALRRNFKSEIAAGTVIIVDQGVWDHDDVLELRRDPNNTAADSFVMLKDGSHGVKVPLTTIDKLVERLKLPRVDFIKMDIEGAEQRALKGAAGTLARFHPRLSLAAYHVPDDPVRMPELVRAAWPGYTTECGPCAETEDYRVRPDVLYFH